MEEEPPKRTGDILYCKLNWEKYNKQIYPSSHLFIFHPAKSHMFTSGIMKLAANDDFTLCPIPTLPSVARHTIICIVVYVLLP